MRQHVSRADLPDGPRTFPELQEWNVHTFDRCVEQGWACDWADRGERSVYLTAKWAGLGGMPIGFAYACEAINSNEQVSTHIDLKLYAMADLDSTCQGNDFFLTFCILFVL